MPNMTALPDNFSISIGYIPEEYSYEVYNVDGRRLYRFEFYEYHKMREIANKATRSGRSVYYVVAINFKGRRVFYTNMKRQKSLEPMHWRQTRAEVE